MPASIHITDVLGKVVLSETAETTTINIQNLQAGIYFLTVKNNANQIANLKFIKD